MKTHCLHSLWVSDAAAPLFQDHVDNETEESGQRADLWSEVHFKGNRGEGCSSDETISQSSLSVYTCKKSHTRVKDPVGHVRIWWIMETRK